MAVALRGNEILVGGHFTHAGGMPANHIACWDGLNWSTLGSGFSDGLTITTVNALAVAADRSIYAAGDFQTADGKPANFVAHWDGSTWEPLGSGLDNAVNALALKGNDLYLGGEHVFMAGCKPSSMIAVWHGGMVSDLPSLGISKQINHVTVSWPVSASDFILEHTSQAIPNDSWFPVVDGIETNEEMNFLTLPITNNPQFFRLRK